MARIEAVGLLDLDRFFKIAPELTAKAASMAINDTIRGKGMKLIRSKIMDEVAFSSEYLTGDRLKVGMYATPENLAGVIIGRKRATSLARFANGGAINKAGVSVNVQRGRTTMLRKAFLVKLRRGPSVSEDNYNLGLAIRVQPGEDIANKRDNSRKHWLVKDKVQLLYGPSVDQVFSTVAVENAQQIAEITADEFNRQFARLTSG
jgi:hypothetical protein